MRLLVLYLLSLFFPALMKGETPKPKKKQQTWEQSALRNDPNSLVVFGKGRDMVEAQRNALANVPRALVGSMGGQAGDVPPYQILEQYVEYSKKEGYKVILFVKSNNSLTDEEKLKTDFKEELFRQNTQEKFKEYKENH